MNKQKIPCDAKAVQLSASEISAETTAENWNKEEALPLLESDRQQFMRCLEERLADFDLRNKELETANIILQEQLVRERTLQKVVLDELEESRETHRGLSEAAFDSIFFSEKGICIEQNETAEKVFGHTKEEALGRYGTEWIVPEDRKTVMDNMLAGYLEPYEVTALKKDGSTFPALLSGKMMFYKGKNVRVTSLSDISARKIAEVELIKARQEAEQANHAKSEFISRMSHELRTPLNSILGFAQLLDMDELTPVHKKRIYYILNSGRHLLNLINEVLDIAQIESGRISIFPETIRLGSFIAEMAETVKPLADQQQITLEVVKPDSNELFVISDLMKLNQILLNIISNAIKYNRPGGSVVIKTEILSNYMAGVDFCRISVKDTGLGISPEDIQKLYIPFERIGAEKMEIEGTGLGLALVKKLTEAMGINFQLDSSVGEGSTFWFEMPLVFCKKPDIEDHSISELLAMQRKHRSGTILYIEDNLSNIELVEEIIRNHRPEIRLIRSLFGKQAVEFANIYAPDLILLDLDLPDIHGSEVFINLQAEARLKKIPVVIVSADAMTRQIEKILKAGARNYLTKPLDIGAFLRIVDEWI